MKIILTDKERALIFSKIAIDPVTDCWDWLAAKNGGYGVLNFRGKTTRAHRLLYEVFIDELPKYNGTDVLDHVVCDRPGCCNPKHVQLVQQSFNVLRANSVSGQNKRKTHCIRGHLLPTAREPYGKGKLGRRCIICRRRNRMRRYYASK